MSTSARPKVAIVDYGLGNLCSVQLACERVRLEAEITNDPSRIEAADGVILPGVGAFKDAMDELQRTGAADAIMHAVAAGKGFFGICLGFQLLMTESFEFGRHAGLGLVQGRVVPVEARNAAGERLKVPHVGWARVEAPAQRGWVGTLCDGVPDGAFMYFVHSYHVVVTEPSGVLAMTQYGDLRFCSAFVARNVFACQFHPERSGPDGLRMYANFARLLTADEALTTGAEQR